MITYLFNTPGVGGMAVIVILGAFLFAYFFTLRWIMHSGNGNEEVNRGNGQ